MADDLLHRIVSAGRLSHLRPAAWTCCGVTRAPTPICSRYATRADWSEPHYERMLTDNALRHRMGIIARKRVVERFTVQRWNDSYRERYSELTGAAR